MSVVTEPGDKAVGERIICQYRKEDRAILIQLTGGHRGLRRIIKGLPAEAIIDKKWKLTNKLQEPITIREVAPIPAY